MIIIRTVVVHVLLCIHVTATYVQAHTSYERMHANKHRTVQSNIIIHRRLVKRGLEAHILGGLTLCRIIEKPVYVLNIYMYVRMCVCFFEIGFVFVLKRQDVV